VKEDSLSIDITNLQTRPLDEGILRAAARHALEAGERSLDCLSLVYVDEDRIIRLNQRFLGRSYPTDVIAFPAEATAEGKLGEAIICVDVAAQQAGERNHSLEYELGVLTAHGTLHAMDYRDDTPAGRAEMERIQTAAAEAAMASASSSAQKNSKHRNS
jgi:probable rRNA maturation factor